MIQRIQSLWLLLAAACAFASLKSSMYIGVIPTDPARKLIHVNGTESILLMATTLIVGIVALLTIFLYKNRKQQFRITLLTILLECLLLFLYYREIKSFAGDGGYVFGAVFHVIIFILLILAARDIRMDEKLIRDSDRLR